MCMFLRHVNPCLILIILTSHNSYMKAFAHYLEYASILVFSEYLISRDSAALISIPISDISNRSDAVSLCSLRVSSMTFTLFNACVKLLVSYPDWCFRRSRCIANIQGYVGTFCYPKQWFRTWLQRLWFGVPLYHLSSIRQLNGQTINRKPSLWRAFPTSSLRILSHLTLDLLPHIKHSPYVLCIWL